MITRRELLARTGVAAALAALGITLGDEMNLQPDSLPTTMADFDRRLRALEGASRVGLNRVRFAWSTHFVPPAPAAYGSWESGSTSATWEDDQGNTGTGYPRVTLVTGTKVLMIAQSYPQSYAHDPAVYKADTCNLGIGLDGGAANAWSPAAPLPTSYNSRDTATPVYAGSYTLTLNSGRADLAPGEHTFQLQHYWSNYSAGALTDAGAAGIFLAVIPIDL